MPLPASLLLPLVPVDCDAPVVDAEPVDSAVRDPVEVPVDPDTAVDSGKSRAVKSERDSMRAVSCLTLIRYRLSGNRTEVVVGL